MVKDSNNLNRTAVVGIEHIEPLLDMSIINLKKSYSSELANNQIKMVFGDGRLGYSDQSPFDVIHVGAAAPEIPKELIS